ncbi:MAG TPA: hypothetical protein VMR70_04015 [Flavisolibacter sp.]|nr:hypothetical protein [Flavisolibacter sp.]
MPDELLHRGPSDVSNMQAPRYPQQPAQGINRPQVENGCSAEATAQPSRSDRPRSISIEAKDHGFIVMVGCQSFAIEKVSTLIRNLEKYLEHPNETERKWTTGKLEL